MIKAILKGILKMIKLVLNIVLLPINSLIENLFPNMSNAITQFTNFLNQTFSGWAVWFFHILPPNFRNIMILWFGFVISYYTIYYSYLGILKIWGVIQKIKFW